MKKTNAARFLDKLKIEYEIREYEVDESDLSAENVARKVDLPLAITQAEFDEFFDPTTSTSSQPSPSRFTASCRLVVA